MWRAEELGSVLRVVVEGSGALRLRALERWGLVQVIDAEVFESVVDVDFRIEAAIDKHRQVQGDFVKRKSGIGLLSGLTEESNGDLFEFFVGGFQGIGLDLKREDGRERNPIVKP